MQTILQPFERFFKLESSSSILLFAAAIIAMAWANSPYSDSYFELWNKYLTLGYGSFELSKPLLLWINDGLMAIFFFVIGLEIKREVLVGELNSVQKATLPVIGAIGGMLFPIAIFFLLNQNEETFNGWAIPMATDIAFTLGILKILGNRVPIGLKIFLTAFAIVDDIGAVLVIAFFYSDTILWDKVGLAMLLWAILMGLSMARLYSKYIMLILGIVVWYLFLKSGIHPTVAGIILALAVPIRRKINNMGYINKVKEALGVLKNQPKSDEVHILNSEEVGAIVAIDDATNNVSSRLQQLEHGMHGWVSYVIIPIFALSNAGVNLTESSNLNMRFILVIAASLVLGNFIGISTLCWIAIKRGYASLPERVSFKALSSVAFLGGLGFTMSIFISGLAFQDPVLVSQAKLGVILGSIISGVAGYVLLKSIYSDKNEANEMVAASS